jgi:ribonuclease HI
MKVTVNVDGGARGNPGPAAVAAVVQDAGGGVLEERAERIGTATNNVAEYRALLLALDRAERRGATEVWIESDSLLLVEQILGRFRVKAAHLQPLFADALRRSRAFARFAIRHVRREQNVDADRLANLGADESERLLAAAAGDASPWGGDTAPGR